MIKLCHISQLCKKFVTKITLLLLTWNGPHRPPKIQFQSINIFTQSNDYTDLREKNIIKCLRIEWSIFHKYLNVLHSSMCCAKFEKKISKFPQCIFAISLLSPLEKKPGPCIWTNLNHSPSPKDALYQV